MRRHRITPDKGFAAIDTEHQVGVYSYPTSDNAIAAMKSKDLESLANRVLDVACRDWPGNIPDWIRVTHYQHLVERYWPEIDG
jgi:hypothetical protein